MHATIAVSFSSPDVRVRIAGELDIAYRRLLRTHAADVLAGSTGTVALDLAGVTLVDCACLRTLDRFRRDLAADGRRFVITDASLAFSLVAYLAEHDELLRSIDGSGVSPLRTRQVAGPRAGAARRALSNLS